MISNDAGVGIVQFNQPQKSNALSDSMMAQLCEFIAAAAESASLRALLLTGVGRNFCAGADLHKSDNKQSLEEKNLHSSITFWLNRLILAIVQAPFPIIAAVNGTAAGAGAGIALAADFMMVSAESQLNFSFSRLGLAADAGTSWFLPKLLGNKHAASILMLAESLDGSTLYEKAIAIRMFEQAQLFDGSLQFARTLAEGPTLAYAAQKRLLNNNSGLLQALEQEALAQQQLLASNDCRAALLAYRNQQTVRFKGR